MGVGGKKENCRPGFENECFLLAGSSLCLLLLRRVSQCCAISSLRERRHCKREFCLPAAFLFFARCGCNTGTDNQHSFMYYMFLVRLPWFSQHHRTPAAQFGPPGPSWRSSLSAAFQQLLSSQQNKNQSKFSFGNSKCSTGNSSVCADEIFPVQVTLICIEKPWLEGDGHCLLSSNAPCTNPWIYTFKGMCRRLKISWQRTAWAQLPGVKCQGADSSEKNNIPSLKGPYKERDWLFTWSNTDRTNGNGFKLKEGRFRLDVRRNSLLRGRWGPGTGWGCPWSLWMLHPWRCSRPGGMESWALIWSPPT